MERVYRNSTLLMGALTLMLGVALVAVTLAKGGGPASLGLILGVLFTALGAARVYLARAG